MLQTLSVSPRKNISMLLPKLKSHIKKRIMTSGSRVSCGPSRRSTSLCGMQRSTRRVQGDGQGGWVAPPSIPEVALGFRKDAGGHGDTIATIAEVIELMDPFLLYLKVLTLVSKYPDIRDEPISTLLAMRSNVRGTWSRSSRLWKRAWCKRIQITCLPSKKS